jgi:RNA polymerase sigma-70 factor (ECF subfamily)
MNTSQAQIPLAAPDERVEEQALARRVAAGDRSAFELLMRRHNRRLFRLARATLRDDAEAEDALQEAYLQAYRAISAFRGEASLATWLSRLVLNECLGRLRRQARRDKVVPMVSLTPTHDDETAFEPPAPPAAGDPHRALARAELRALIERQLDRLPRAFRTVFVMREVEDMDVEEVAHCLELPPATVRSRHFRARALLREALERELGQAQRDLYDFCGERCDRVVRGVLARLEGGA